MDARAPDRRVGRRRVAGCRRGVDLAQTTRAGRHGHGAARGGHADVHDPAGLFPGGGEAHGLTGALLAAGIAATSRLGALMTLGIGLYAPCMIMISLLGMNPPRPSRS